MTSYMMWGSSTHSSSVRYVVGKCSEETGYFPGSAQLSAFFLASVWHPGSSDL